MGCSLLQSEFPYVSSYTAVSTRSPTSPFINIVKITKISSIATRFAVSASPSRNISSRSTSLLQRLRSVQGTQSASSAVEPLTMDEAPSFLTPTKGENDTAAEAFYPPDFRLLFVEMGVGYDQHGQDVTSAAVKACKNAITSNSIPAFRTGALPGINYTQMKLLIKLGVPRAVQSQVDIQKVKAVFPYGEIIKVDLADGGLICSSGVALEAMGDTNDDCYVVNAAVYIGY